MNAQDAHQRLLTHLSQLAAGTPERLVELLGVEALAVISVQPVEYCLELLLREGVHSLCRQPKHGSPGERRWVKEGRMRRKRMLWKNMHPSNTWWLMATKGQHRAQLSRRKPALRQLWGGLIIWGKRVSGGGGGGGGASFSRPWYLPRVADGKVPQN